MKLSVLKIYNWLIIFSSVLVFSGCENNIEVIKSITNTKDIPVVSAQDVEIVYSDSSYMKFKAVAKVLNKFNSREKKYIEFPKGIIIYKYDTTMQIEAIIRANYAKYFEEKKLWEARNDVVALNLLKNEQLYTEELIWDQNKKIIFSNKFTKIINPDGVFYGDGGFNAKEDLSYWKLLGIKGKVNF